MDVGLTGKVALVTGATGSIGSAISRALAREGARVALGYHSRKDVADELVFELRAAGGEAIAVPHDLESSPTAAAPVEAVTEAWGGIDVLVAAAVVWPQWPAHGSEQFQLTPGEIWRQQLGANAEGTALTIQAVLPHMQSQGWGRIVLLSTTVAEDGFPGMEAYGASKAALLGLARSLSAGVASSGILVNVVEPGLVPTEKNKLWMPDALDVVAGITPTRRLATPFDVALVVTFLASAANGNVAGAALRVNGGL